MNKRVEAVPSPINRGHENGSWKIQVVLSEKPVCSWYDKGRFRIGAKVGEKPVNPMVGMSTPPETSV
jgi:hypothetical protein